MYTSELIFYKTKTEKACGSLLFINIDIKYYFWNPFIYLINIVNNIYSFNFIIYLFDNYYLTELDIISTRVYIFDLTYLIYVCERSITLNDGFGEFKIPRDFGRQRRPIRWISIVSTDGTLFLHATRLLRSQGVDDRSGERTTYPRDISTTGMCHIRTNNAAVRL